jgi:hypothetical protein
MKPTYEQMAVFAPNFETVIVSIGIENKLSGIHVDLIINNGKIKTKIISHDCFRAWLDDNDRLEWTTDTSHTVTGAHVQESGKWGYWDYLNAFLDADLVYEYLTDKGLTNLKYQPE